MNGTTVRAPFRVPAWVVLLMILLVTAVWSVFPLYSPRTPGTLRVGVIAGEDPALLERALEPLADFLGRSVRRSGTVRVVTARQVMGGSHASDLLLVPRHQQVPDDHEILAWTKPIGLVGLGTPVVLVTRKGPLPDGARWGLGDPYVMGGPDAARSALEERGIALTGDPPVIGVSPYRHDEVITLLAHGVVDRVVVRREDVDRAKAAGRLDPESIRVEVLEDASARFALVAAPSLSEPARHRLRARALDLDALRLNPQTGMASSVVNALAQVGLGGFAPIEPFPSLRP